MFDIVYAWGVLHHTGDLHKSIQTVANLVKPNGKFAIAVYRKTKLCQFWKIEKAYYNKAPIFIQRCIRCLFSALLLTSHCIHGRSPLKIIREYKAHRGMSFAHDVHDWLGGYPYESITPEQMGHHAEALGFSIEYKKIKKGGLGLFGSGCDEYLLTKTQ